MASPGIKNNTQLLHRIKSILCSTNLQYCDYLRLQLTDVHISVWDAETYIDLPGAIVTMNGTTYSTPFGAIFGEGTVLHMLAFIPGYTDAYKTVIVKDTSLLQARLQLITFILSAKLVRYFFFQNLRIK